MGWEEKRSRKGLHCAKNSIPVPTDNTVKVFSFVCPVQFYSIANFKQFLFLILKFTLPK